MAGEPFKQSPALGRRLQLSSPSRHSPPSQAMQMSVLNIPTPSNTNICTTRVAPHGCGSKRPGYTSEHEQNQLAVHSLISESGESPPSCLSLGGEPTTKHGHQFTETGSRCLTHLETPHWPLTSGGKKASHALGTFGNCRGSAGSFAASITKRRHYKRDTPKRRTPGKRTPF